MVEFRSILLFVAIMAFVMFFFEKSKPEKSWTYWRMAIIAVLSSSGWFWYERFVPIIEASPDYGTFMMLGLLGFFIWLIIGVYRSRSPIDK